MDNRKNDNYYVEKVIDNIDAIASYTIGKTYDEFVNDDMLVDAVMFRLVQMVENMKKISQKFKDENKAIPWGLIAGFRNGIVHDYGKTDYTVVYEIVSGDIFKLKENLKKAIDK